MGWHRVGQDWSDLAAVAAGETADPSPDPNWNYNDPEHIWERDHFLICVKAGPKEAQQKVISYTRISAITQEPNEKPIPFLERLKEAFQKFTSLDLDSYKGQVILKDKFLSQCASDITIKLQHLQNQDPAASLDEMVQTATNTFYNRTGEGSQGPGEGEKERDKSCPDAGRLPGKPYGKPMSLKNKVWGKCLICRQAGHWAKECPNHDKCPKMACYNCHQLGHWAALWPWGPGASRSSAKPSFLMVQKDWNSLLQPVRLSQITIMGLEPRVQLDVAGRPENFLVDTGATYSVLTSWSGAFSSQTCTIWGATRKTITKRFTGALLCSWNGQILSTSFLWLLSVLFPYWEEIFPCLRNLAATAVLIEDALKLSFGGKLFLPATKLTTPE